MNLLLAASRKLALAAAAAAMLSAAPAAMADPLAPTGYAAGSQSFGVSTGGTVNAGGFAGTWNSQAIIFWCIELTQYFQFGQTYNDYVPVALDNGTMTLLGKLFTAGYAGALANSQSSAAFQLAIWEIVYDPANLNISGGGFHVTSGNAATIAAAQALLNSLANTPDNYNLILLTSRTHQDFITFGGPFDRYFAPEPLSLALLGTAFVAMMIALRRRRPSPRAG